jgi:hypothetical protein
LLSLLWAVRRHPATAYMLRAFTLNWSVWVARARVTQGLLTAQWPLVVGEYWAWGPALAAAITAALVGRGVLRNLGARPIRGRVRRQAIVLVGVVAHWVVVHLIALPRPDG